MKNSVINDDDDRMSDEVYVCTPGAGAVQQGIVVVHQDGMVTVALENSAGTVTGYVMVHEHTVIYKIKI